MFADLRLFNRDPRVNRLCRRLSLVVMMMPGYSAHISLPQQKVRQIIRRHDCIRELRHLVLPATFRPELVVFFPILICLSLVLCQLRLA